MARTAKVVVQAERLRDQVYELIRGDLKSGDIPPGQRLVEVELAGRYGVSRTPIREALFQLTRAGYIEDSERGYSAPAFSERNVRDRLEVKHALTPAVAAHAARTATPFQIRRLTRAQAKEKAAHADGDVDAFIEANDAYRAELHAMCANKLLSRCLQMVEDQYDAARNRIHQIEENRRLTIEHDGRLLAAIAHHDKGAAVSETQAFLAFLDKYYAAQV